MAALAMLANPLYAGSTGIVVFSGLPDRAVAWSLVSGSGTLTPITSYTDAAGHAWARYEPLAAGAAVIEATHGA